MSESDSTTNVGNCGLCLFNAYQKNNWKPLVEDMTEEYVEDDNIKIHINWL